MADRKWKDRAWSDLRAFDGGKELPLDLSDSLLLIDVEIREIGSWDPLQQKLRLDPLDVWPSVEFAGSLCKRARLGENRQSLVRASCFAEGIRNMKKERRLTQAGTNGPHYLHRRSHFFKAFFGLPKTRDD